jgi:hypothetical protein
MTKQEMTALLRSVGVSENTVTAMENAYDMGVEAEREACAKLCQETFYSTLAADEIRARGTA